MFSKMFDGFMRFPPTMCSFIDYSIMCNNNNDDDDNNNNNNNNNRYCYCCYY